MLTRLFPEILSYIMVLARNSVLLDLDEDDSDDPLPPQQPFEVLISHVNASLRTTALATTSLWSSIRLRTSTQIASVTVDRVSAYLERSGSHLLDLRIEIDDLSASSAKSSLLQAMEVVANESMRWRKLTIMAEHNGITEMTACIWAKLLANGEELVPNLEYLSLSVDYSEEAFASIQSESASTHRRSTSPLGESYSRFTLNRIALRQLPMLSFLRLRGLAFYLFQPFHLPNLTTLHLDQTKAIPLSFTFINNLVATCPALERLSIYGDIVMPSESGAYDETTISHAPIPVQIQPLDTQSGVFSIGGIKGEKSEQGMQRIIRLHELRSLRLSGVSGTVFRVLLSRLEAPNLRSLSLKDVQEHDIDVLWDEPIKDGRKGVYRARKSLQFLPRFTELRSLTINNSDLSLSVYERLFQVFPRVVDFTSYSSVDVDDVPRLLLRGTVGVPWPLLRRLTFVFNVDLYADDEMIEELLKGREEAGYPIEELRIGVAELDDEDMEGLEEQRAVVVLQKLTEVEVWQSRYRDIDDILF